MLNPFRDFAPFATACLGPDTELRLAMPFPELQHRLNNLTSLDRCYEQLHASPLDLQRLLAQLQTEGPCSLERLLSAWSRAPPCCMLSKSHGIHPADRPADVAQW